MGCTAWLRGILAAYLASLQLVCMCREEGSSSTLNEAFEDLETPLPDGSVFNMGPAAEQDTSSGAQEAGEPDEAYGNGDADE